MNSREISKLFKQEGLQFNPIETFGNRQAPQSQERGQRRGNDRKRDRLEEEEEEDLENARQQTRIKLLSSYQESYLQSISQHNFTQGDQLSDLRAIDKSNNLSYSESKRSEAKLDQYMASEPNEQINEPRKFSIHKNMAVQIHEEPEVNFTEKLNSLSKSSQNLPPKSCIKEDQDRMKSKEQKIRELSQAIEEQIYNLSVQDRLYEYLMSRIDERGRVRQIKDSHQVIEKAIDFMDSGEQFMKSLLKLSKMQGC